MRKNTFPYTSKIKYIGTKSFEGKFHRFPKERKKQNLEKKAEKFPTCLTLFIFSLSVFF